MSRLAEGGFDRAALQSGCRFSAGLAEARALMAAGRPDEAERLLAGLTAPNERGAVTLALVRARNLFWALNRPGEAEAVLTAAERALAARAAAARPADPPPPASAAPSVAPPPPASAAPLAPPPPASAAPSVAPPPPASAAPLADPPPPASVAPSVAPPPPASAAPLAPPPPPASAAPLAPPPPPASAAPLAAPPPAPPAPLAALACVSELHALRARFAFAQGDPRAALAAAAPIEADPAAPEAARLRAAIALAEALAVCGRRDEAVAVARRWEPASQRQLTGAQALAHWLAGSLHEATYEAERAYAAATDPQGWAVAALLLGHVWLSRGDTGAALRWFRESSALLRGSDPVGMRPAALAGIAQAAAQAGDAVHARKAIAELDRMPHAAGRGAGEELGLARAWTAHASGDHSRAVALATDVLATAEARGANGFAARARAELARLIAGQLAACG